uniref:Uncharacterized protein n=1 Tax=Branchiostoma floridae TaxID=7739 RepID=C3YWL1_BRAFL|eukprot:XP_002599243.1 hypothetical protein BRAFLDRAFT_64407 [Branchiostoma floridae]
MGRCARRGARNRRRGAERPSYYRTVLAIRLLYAAFLIFVIGIILTAMLAASGSRAVITVGACVLGVGAVLLGAGLWFCNRQWKNDCAANDAKGSNIIGEVEATATTPLTPKVIQCQYTVLIKNFPVFYLRRWLTRASQTSVRDHSWI